MDYGKMIETLHNMILDLSKEVQQLRNENLTLKENIMVLNASNAISKGDIDVRPTVGANNIINEKSRKNENDAIQHFNNMVEMFGNTLDESNDIIKQR